MSKLRHPRAVFHVLMFFALSLPDGFGQEQKLETARQVSAPPKIESSWNDLVAGVTSREQWLGRKKEIRQKYLDLIRDQHKPEKPALDLHVHDRLEIDGVYERRLVSYQVEKDERAHAYLAVPLDSKGERLPAIVALHGTFEHGKERASGLADNPDKAWLDHLARRGYVVIAPDHFVAGHRTPAEGPYDTIAFHQKHPHWTAVGKFTYEHSIAVDVLQSMPKVDPDKIGALGHSLGGHGTFFLAAYDPRIQAAASNCSASFFRHNNKVTSWSRDHWYTYFKHLREGLLRGELPPIDFHEIIALIAPRAFLDISAVNDGDPLTQKQRTLMNLSIMDAYKWEDAMDHYGFYVHGRGHSAKHESRELMFAWMDTHLKPEEATATTLVDAPDLKRIEVLLVDPQAHGYATFQSHNQKVVTNQDGIFLSHLRSRNEDYTAQQWRLSRSTDGGESFETVFEATNATNPPALEIDNETLYLARPDFVDGHAYLYRFNTSEPDFSKPTITRIPGGAAGKYAMALDRKRRQLHYFAHNNTFHTLDLEGRVLKYENLIVPGADAILQYPHLYSATNGELHAAWTTQKKGVYLYWDIHHMFSPELENWRNLSGGNLKTPVVADHGGPALRLTSHDEFESHTWLSSMAVTRNKVHFLYLAQTKPPRQHYIRYDRFSGQRDMDLHPRFGTDRAEIRALGAFFVVDRREGKESTIYCIGGDSTGHVSCLRSRDEGSSWEPFAKTHECFNVYAPGGFRDVTEDGYIIGSFTDQQGDNGKTDQTSQVYFLRIAVDE